MKKKPLKAHFLILLLGSIIFLMHFFGSFEPRGSSRTIPQLWRIKNLLLSIALYIVFATLVIGHGISDIGRESIKDAESNTEVLEGEVENTNEEKNDKD